MDKKGEVVGYGKRDVSHCGRQEGGRAYSDRTTPSLTLRDADGVGFAGYSFRVRRVGDSADPYKTTPDRVDRDSCDTDAKREPRIITTVWAQ